MPVRLVKEPDNKNDQEAIKVELPGLGTIGYVANSTHTVIGECMSAGRIYDKIGDRYNMDNYWSLIMNNDYMMTEAIKKVKGVDPLNYTIEDQLDVQQKLLQIKTLKMVAEMDQDDPWSKK